VGWFAAFYRINPATAAKGFAALVDQGVLYKKRGIGMFVSPNARARLLDERRQRFFTDVVDPMLAEASSASRTSAASVPPRCTAAWNPTTSGAPKPPV
jgi:DNA-binding transcriptional regulator YhcF (GntR family)